MTAYLKSNSPKEFAELVARLEGQADACFENLAIYQFPKNAAIWAVLAQAVERIENAARTRGYGSQSQLEAMINLAHAVALLTRWVRTRGMVRPESKPPAHLNRQLAEAARQAIQTALNYVPFISNFSLWHRDGIFAEAAGQNRIRFINAGGPQQRRVRAYQQGVRPPNCPATVDHPAPPPIKSAKISARIHQVLERSTKKGTTRFSYVPPHDVYRELATIYSDRLTELFRRDSSLDLGGYDLDDFRRIYGAIMGVCALHEHVCFLWAEKFGRYPVDSAVLSLTTQQWVDLLSSTSGLDAQKCEKVLQDLVKATTNPIDLHVHPFVPADETGRRLYLVPHFPLHARPDENALRVCSYVRPDLYDATSARKESETIQDLKSAPSGFKIHGPVSLAKGLPDIDLVVVDTVARVIANVELKWIRKAVRAVEHIAADQELRKGLAQLAKVRDFLSKNPDHLSLRGVATGSLETYDVHYLLVARDHFKWIEPPEGLAVVAYDPFKLMLSDATDLKSGIAGLLKFHWLPVEGRNFRVQFTPFEANGVTIEAEVFYRVQTVPTS